MVVSLLEGEETCPIIFKSRHQIVLLDFILITTCVLLAHSVNIQSQEPLEQHIARNVQQTHLEMQQAYHLVTHAL